LKKEKAISFIVNSVYVFLFAAILFFIVPKTFKLILPFVIAYFISLLITPIVNELHYKHKVPKRIAIIILMLLIISSFILILFNVIYQAVFAMQGLSQILPDIFYGNYTFPKWVQSIYDFYLKLPTTKQLFIDNIIINIKNSLSNFVKPATTIAFNTAKNIASSIPDIFIFTIVLIIATYFICADKDKIENVFSTVLPKKMLEGIKKLKDILKTALGGYLISQLILMCINFIILITGFLILKIKYAFLMAVLVALLDALPVFGSGIILIPWALFNFLSGNYKISIVLFGLYVIIALVRQFLEPKIMGSKLGVHPLVMLVSMFVLFKLIGFLGLILGPALAIILTKIYKTEDVENFI